MKIETYVKRIMTEVENGKVYYEKITKKEIIAESLCDIGILEMEHGNGSFNCNVFTKVSNYKGGINESDINKKINMWKDLGYRI